MLNFNLKTPVAFIIFKRPDTTLKVFEAIRQVKPAKLFVIADGPREDKPGEGEKCAATRGIIEQVDWDCEVYKNYSDVNLGCGKRIYTGLNWVFDHVDEAIILEDDCIPDLTFFPFCEELLEKYKFDTRIFSISSQNFLFGQMKDKYSYYFSRYHHSWGWATWKRAWQYFDFDMVSWPEMKSRDFLKSILIDNKAVNYWTEIFDYTYKDHQDLWDYQWLFASWVQSGIHIAPSVNLVSNIGFGPEATNTLALPKNYKYAEMDTEPITFPLKYPPLIISDRKKDDFVQKTRYQKSLSTIMKSKIKNVLSWFNLSVKYGKIYIK